MRAYKFLDAEGRAPFTATPWTPHAWVETTTARACREGVHACRSADVAYWFDDAMWEVELDGEIIETRHKVVATRGRLVRRITDYPEAARELAELGTWRCRDRAVDALRTAGDGELAARFAAAATLEELADCGGDVVDSNWAGAAAALAADAAHFAIHGNRAQSPFVAACSAGHATAGPDGGQDRFDSGYTAERGFQSAWLASRLRLDESTAAPPDRDV